MVRSKTYRSVNVQTVNYDTLLAGKDGPSGP